MLKKTISGFLSVLLISGFLGTTSFAMNEDYNFNDQTQKLVLVQDGSTVAGAGYYNRNKDGAKFIYENAFLGRKSGDYSQTMYIDNVPQSDQAGDGYTVTSNIQLTAARTLEFSFAADGDYDQVYMILRHKYTATDLGYDNNFLGFKQDGSIYLRGSKVGTFDKRQWQRVALTYYPDGTYDLWINGNMYNDGVKFNTSKTALYGFSWIQMDLQIPKNSTVVTKELRSAMISVDDCKEYAGVYDYTLDKINYSILSDAGNVAVRSKNSVYLTAGATVESLTTELVQYESFSFYTDGTFTQPLTTGVIPEGAYLVLRSVNGEALNYLKLTYDENVKTLYNTNFNNNETINKADIKTYTQIAHEAQLFGKGPDDKAYVFNAQVPANVEENGGRFSLDNSIYELCDRNWGDLSVDKQEITLEASAAVSGESGLRLLGRPRFYNKSNPAAEVRGYKIYMEMSPDGSAVAVDSAIKEFKFNKNEWVRIAMTIYPAQMQYDLYLNGEKIVDKAWLDSIYTDTQAYAYRGFNWLSLSGSYLKISDTDVTLRTGKAALDDYKVYLGGYKEDSQNIISLTSNFPIDNTNGYIYVDNGLDVTDFASGLSFGAANAAIYSDNTYLVNPTEIVEGNVLVLTSENGYVMKYYTIVPLSISIDNQISLYVDDQLSNILSVGNLKASINAYAPLFADKSGALVLAVYENGDLKGVVVDSKQIDGRTNYETAYTLASTAGIKVKAMFFESLENLKPLTDSNSYITVE